MILCMPYFAILVSEDGIDFSGTRGAGVRLLHGSKQGIFCFAHPKGRRDDEPVPQVAAEPQP